ncbi:hypothetical protein JD276_12365 [Leucobacter sp. CSA1]|uniref:Uncharacterized protein n=1 Tax=Leucobacter chromiisoli TaxID=2796471 RepID=A0A934Q8S2_9MICO|nr:hypothetical protein [Leucobacter chromiisoli]MBK0419828.1 hypothetical protein [Leucobacter chromiisoli]
MSRQVLRRGDPLPQMTFPPVQNSEGADPERPFGLLWGLDLTDCKTRKQAKQDWRRAVDGVKAALDRYPSIRRVCLTCLRPRAFPGSVTTKVPGGLSLQLHNDLERDRGRYVQTLVLDATACHDPAALGDRIEEVFEEGCDGWSELTLSWDEVAEDSIREVWESQNF